jgi:hypothetical protein
VCAHRHERRYSTPSTPGSRPGLLSAATWASMMRLGEAGYLDATRRILEAAEQFQATIQRIDGARGYPHVPVSCGCSGSCLALIVWMGGVHLRRDPCGWDATLHGCGLRLGGDERVRAWPRVYAQQDACMSAIDGDDSSASALVKICPLGRYKINAALSKRGYHMAGCQAPPCVHLALTLRHVGPVMDEICAALEAAVEEVRAAPRIEGEAEATVGIYGSEAEVSEPLRLFIPPAVSAPPLPTSLHPVRAHRPLGARTHTGILGYPLPPNPQCGLQPGPQVTETILSPAARPNQPRAKIADALLRA